MNKTKLDLYFEAKIANDPRLKAEAEKAGRAIDISMQIYALRKNRNITQKELAKLVGTKQANIARLENADYSGYTMQTLNKIAEALSAHLSISLTPKEEENTEYAVKPSHWTSTVINCANCPVIGLNGNNNVIRWSTIFDIGECFAVDNKRAKIEVTSEAKNSKEGVFTSL